MRIITMFNVRNRRGRQKKCTDQFVMVVAITRYREGWLKVYQYDKYRTVKLLPYIGNN
jgi:hypothetical protein